MGPPMPHVQHAVGEACRAVQPHFTDGKADVQGHWGLRGGAGSPAPQPGSGVYTLTRQARRK